MSELATISFMIGPPTDAGTAPIMITPMIDGIALTELVRRFEVEREFQPAGGYTGIAPTVASASET